MIGLNKHTYFRDSKYFTEYNNSFKGWPSQKPPSAVFHTMGGGINFSFAGDWHCYYIFCKSTTEWLTYHETEQHGYRQPSENGDCGSSWEDLFSSYEGIDLGAELKNGDIKILDFGNNLRSRLGGEVSHNFCTDFISKVPQSNT